MKLLNFLKKLVNETVKIETKDNLSLEGTIVKVDKHSNLYLKEIKIGDSKIEKFTIKGTNIRFIKFRDDLAIEKYCK